MAILVVLCTIQGVAWKIHATIFPGYTFENESVGSFLLNNERYLKVKTYLSLKKRWLC